MTSNQESIYWKTNEEWYTINDKGEYELTDKATEKAKESFALYNSKDHER